MPWRTEQDKHPKHPWRGVRALPPPTLADTSFPPRPTPAPQLPRLPGQSAMLNPSGPGSEVTLRSVCVGNTYPCSPVAPDSKDFHIGMTTSSAQLKPKLCNHPNPLMHKTETSKGQATSSSCFWHVCVRNTGK